MINSFSTKTNERNHNENHLVSLKKTEFWRRDFDKNNELSFNMDCGFLFSLQFTFVFLYDTSIAIGLIETFDFDFPFYYGFL